MGLSVLDLATMTPYLFNLKCKGFSDSKKIEEANFRKLGFMVFKMHADPKKSRSTTMDDVWPSIYEDVKDKPKELFSKEQVSEWAKAYSKRKQKIK